MRWSIDIPTFQQAHKYPFLLDPTAEVGQSYQYRVCTQDASTGITNLSEYSPTLDVTYPAYAGYYDSRNDLLEIDLFPWPTILSGETRTLAKGIYYAPFNILVEEGGTLVLDPAVQIIFGDLCELEVKGSFVVNGNPDCERVTLTGVAPQSGGGASGSWWGVSLFPSATHDIDYAIIENGINNLVLFDPGGVVSNTALRYASQHGVIIKNADDSGPAAQLLEQCDIHENGWTNVFMTHGSLDAGGQPIPIYPIIRNSTIRQALTGDGILVADQAFPLIEYCDIHSNATNGIRCEQVRGDVFANSNVTLLHSNIHDHESGAGVFLRGSNGLLRFNELYGNLHGVSANDASILHGALSYGSVGGNSLHDNDIHLRIENCTGIYIGFHFSLLGDSRGHGNTFVAPGSYHIQSVNSAGFAQCNSYNPYDPYANPPHFDIPGFPMTPDIEVLPLGPCVPPGGGTQTILPKTVASNERAFTLGTLPMLFEKHDDASVLKLLQTYELDPICRHGILSWLGTYAASGSHKDRYLAILDSLSQSWQGGMLAQVRHAGVSAFVSRGGMQMSPGYASSISDSALHSYITLKAAVTNSKELSPMEVLQAQIRNNDTVNKTMSPLTPAAGNGVPVPRISVNAGPPQPEYSGLLAYPNPASGMLNLRVTDARRYEQCRVTDLLGRVVMKVDLRTVTVEEGLYRLDLSTLPRNRYLVTLFGEDGTACKTVVLR
ncbi:MAG: right-handed parallel beta-helix repeat-containing protein [Bacteroidia bacterium]|nr:right-handed parallel beta-helix repeat-containing protein [Bacteroidia bacterium]